MFAQMVRTTQTPALAVRPLERASPGQFGRNVVEECGYEQHADQSQEDRTCGDHSTMFEAFGERGQQHADRRNEDERKELSQKKGDGPTNVLERVGS